LKTVFSHTIKEFRSIRTGDYILPDEGLVSFLRRINTQNSLEILTPLQNGSAISWKSKDCLYTEFSSLTSEQKQSVFQIFVEFRTIVLEQAEKVRNQEFTSIKLEQNAKSFSELLKKTVDYQNIKLFYNEEKNRVAIIFGFVFSDEEIVSYGNQFLYTNEPDTNDNQENTQVVERIIDTNSTNDSIMDDPLPMSAPVRRQKHPWWINTIRSINWFAWRYWWLVWLIFLLSLLLLYLFCPSKKTSQIASCDQLHHIHKNIDSLNKGLLFCCDCNRILLPEKPEPEPDTNQINPPKKSPEPPKEAQNCNSFVQSGSDGVDIQYVNLGTKSGRVIITYDMATEPDKLEVFYEGKRVTSTFIVRGNRNGFVGGGNSAGSTGKLIFDYKHNVEDFVKVVLTGGKSTSWSYKISCPE
jgi:hypothetical protein